MRDSNPFVSQAHVTPRCVAGLSRASYLGIVRSEYSHSASASASVINTWRAHGSDRQASPSGSTTHSRKGVYADQVYPTTESCKTAPNIASAIVGGVTVPWSVAAVLPVSDVI